MVLRGIPLGVRGYDGGFALGSIVGWFLGCWRFWPKVEIVGFVAQILSHLGGMGCGTVGLLGGMVTSWRWVEERRRIHKAEMWHGLTVPL